MKTLKSRGGYSMVEIFFVMALLALFGITTYTLVAVGSDSFHDLIEKRDDNANLRVSLSMINMRLRQMDTQNAVSIDKGERGQRLVITETAGGASYNTYLFIRDGKLCEYTADSTAPFDPQSGFELTELTGLSLSMIDSGAALKVEVWVDGESGRKSLSGLVRLRSAEGGEYAKA